MFTRMLVPVDGSEYATRAIPVAARIAQATGAQVILASVVDMASAYAAYLGPVPITQNMIDERYAAQRAYLNALADRNELAGVSVRTEVLTGQVASTLLKAIETEKINLVVMNSHGRSGLARWVLGSVAEQVVQFATAPVLLLRESLEADPAQHASVAGPWQAVVGLDGSALSKEALAPTAQVVQALSGAAGGQIRLVRAVRPLSEADELTPVLGGPAQVESAHQLIVRDAQAALEDEASRLRTLYPALAFGASVLDARDAAAALVDVATHLARESTPDTRANVLIGMATHGRGGLARWTLGSVTYRVLESSRMPLLVVRPGAIAEAQRAAREHLTGGAA